MTAAFPYVAKLFIYPIKSLDSVSVERVTILKSGALKYDRQYAIFDELDHFVNGKRNARVHALRSQINLEMGIVSLCGTETFNINEERKALLNWLSEYFGFPVQIKQNFELGFPDDIVSPGPTIISTATLELIASWYPELDVEEVRRRFRANIEIAGVPAFWEDQLFKEAEQTVNFQIGNVQFMGINPCQRCVVVTRNSQTGEAYPHFQKTFVAKRQETLPDWVERSRFNHFYRLAINTKIPASQEGKIISIGDEVKAS